MESKFKWHPRARLLSGDQVICAQDALPENLPAGLRAVLDALRKGRAIGGAGGDTSPMLHTHSGGSRGAPKIITRTQASWIASFHVNAGLFDLAPGVSAAVIGDLSHSLTLYALLEGVHLGLDIALLTGLRPDRQWAQLLARQTQVFYATPSQLRAMLAHNPAPLPALRHVICGGGFLNPALRALLAKQCPNAQIRAFYGAAETSFIALQTEGCPPGSVGKPYPGVQIDIRGTAGEIWVQSPYLADQTNGASIPRQAGFVTAGELGQLGTEGALFLSGRKDRAVNVADQIVQPEQTEALIAEFAEAAVLPRPDALRGQVLVAVVAGRPDPELAARITAACARALPAAACPRAVLFHPDFPRLSSGKPDLLGLEKWLMET
ncbi:MAG: AMP-binding protein [Sulfitobacter sp.]